jgi:pimeloyl-ACP methyl ester carboxylesterase
MTEHLYFAHANSFPASIYHKMLQPLAASYSVTYLDTIGHDPAFPVTDGWTYLVDEAIQAIESRSTHPVYGVGHSLGGVLMLCAAVARPDLFNGLVILDAPLFSSWRARSIWLAKKLGLIDRITPGGDTLRRRDCWASAAMVHDYYQRKSMFARFDPDCLWDYAEHGTCDDGKGGRKLKFRPQVEHQIYHTIPHNLTHCRGRLQLPAVYLAAQHGSVLHRSDLKFVERGLGMRLAWQAGSHLFPLEYPLETALQIHQAIVGMRAP